MKRTIDILASCFLLILFGVPLIVISLVVKSSSSGQVIHWSRRIGQGNKPFLMPKFRTMKVDTPQVATHLMADPKSHLTMVGGFLRRSSLDELPQLWSVLIGHMSLIGPRPALYNQDDLIGLRTKLGVEKLKPGITGWAQVNGRDELPIPEKVEFDRQYLERHSLVFDLKIMYLTLRKVLVSDGVSH